VVQIFNGPFIPFVMLNRSTLTGKVFITISYWLERR